MKNIILVILVLMGMIISPLRNNANANDNNTAVDGIMKNNDTDIVFADSDIAVVETYAGLIQGYIRNGIYTYHGIPYAEASERFVPAKKNAHWDGVKLAFDYGPISPQQQLFSWFSNSWEAPPRQFIMDNNCLNLNIWTPAINDYGKRPVMVWLHGGGFSAGSAAEQATYDGANLSKKGDVVVVSINHRLNVLGHFDLAQYGEKYKYSANVGIVDIIAALEWIRDNIAQFGGDPNNITVFGESGGGAKVLALMTSPYAKGLFLKGIIQSGATETMGVNFTSQEASKRVTELTLKNLGVNAAQIEALQTIPYKELVEASDSALKQTAEEFKIPAPLGSGYGLFWEPVVEGNFMPTSPVTENGFAEAGKEIPLLIGSNLTEWTAIPQIHNMAKSQTDNQNTWNEKEIAQHLKEAYGANAEIIATAFLEAYPNKTKADAVYIDSTTIRLPLLKIMSHKADQNGAAVYAYIFSWESPVLNGVFTSFHTAEIPFVFNNIDKADTTIGGGKEARILEDRMSQAWINFARNGIPNTDNLPEWQVYNRDSGATMIFDNEVRLVHHHDKKLLSLLAPEYKY